MEAPMKKLASVLKSRPAHWVGDGFPVKSMISPQDPPEHTSPFLLLDYAEPYEFTPADNHRGVGQHPHRGFETVTLAFQGEIAHRDSAGNSGLIGPGDVQWMTAASGVVHEEFHSPEFTRTGGAFEMIQLWVNLPADHKMSKPRYQELPSSSIPVVDLPDGAGTLRVIAGNAFGEEGPAQTVTPINLWDLSLKPSGEIELELPEASTTLLLVLTGSTHINDEDTVSAGDLARFERDGSRIVLDSKEGVRAILLNGTPIDEPVVAHGPFVMNTREEISQAISDFQSGQMGQLA
jgi:redox-sensitive bicupin YhaK (pirin superfamily)